MKVASLVLAILVTVVFCVYSGMMIYKNVIFDRGCEGRIKRAADANTIELATKEMKAVVAYAKANGLTEGYTSILYRTPDEDVEFWYRNLEASLQELKIIKTDATQLEKSNVLIKLRETLLDHGQSVKVTHPSGISVFPYNIAYAIWGWVSFLLAIVFWILFAVACSRYSRY